MGNSRIEQNGNKPCMSKGFIFTEIVIFLLILLSIMWKNQMVMNLVVVLACASIALFTISEGVLLLFSIAVFEASVSFNGDGGWIFMAGILVIKCIYVNRAKLRKDVFIPMIILVIIELLNELLWYKIGGDVLGCLFLICLLAFFVERKETIRIDAWSSLFCFGLSFVVVTIYLLFSYGSISELMSQVMSDNNVFRLGTEQTTEFAGAMGIPLFSIVVITLAMCFLSSKQKKPVQTGVAFILILLAIILGAMTVARSFYLAMAVVIICILCERGQLEKKITCVFIVCLILLGIFYFFQPIAGHVIGNLQYRISADASATGGRTDIWKATLQYLSDHPIALLFGRGACGYQKIGHSGNYLFSAGCHNFFIDILMSWGIVGFICVFRLITKITNLKTIIEVLKKNVFSVLPLVGLFVFSNTALRTNTLKPLVFFFVCLSMINVERSQ